MSSLISNFEKLAQTFLTHYASLAPHKGTKQRLTHVYQAESESDRAYIDRIDRLILEGEPLGDEAKVLGAMKGLKKGSKL